MGKDYYEILGLTRSATDIDIKKAYRKLALKTHPDKDSSENAAAIFAAVAEAYDVLSQPKNKGFYDLYGEDGLKNGTTDGKAGKKGGFYKFTSTPTAIFEGFFGTKNPYAALNEISERFEELTATPQLKKGKQKTFDITVTLEDIYYGTIKKVVHKKKILQQDGTIETQDRELTIDIKAGSKEGTRYVFDKEGNDSPNTEAGPVVYTLATSKHDRFQRKGNDLVYTARIPLLKALCGTTLSITTLDGRTLSEPVTEIVKTGSTKMVLGEGLPTTDDPSVKGDLMIVFDLIFPQTLSDQQKTILASGFYLPQKMTPDQTAAVKAYGKAYSDTLKGWSAGYKS
mmetsp:Transcript_5548/g.6383  ORF Transcript_5548/g.6383 Transcript_5548/m.6383 type:complete len:341 (-) Transcript_5548:411-1433(-)|eukprot:CAMPEP_0197857668 /NCGR_PEP_ID=MMETSP1438-20131217/30975_1 /TAXON_ID=1461541 /ORGANISM="Pterosperma sp., Strain CCMP1384" /LENGTH=340 /DNA_ID=CAMNT_0043473583 /DNA_START=189 /DNA_END=1211 /DNA_ORIENTATION=+